MMWHDFGPLEGPGWAANAVGGAYEIWRFGRFTRNRRYQEIALSILDHVLENGFIDWRTGFIKGYRHVVRDEFVLNYRHNNDWFCPGSMAKIGFQLLRFADFLPDGERKKKMCSAAVRCAVWIEGRVEPTGSGWYPRRCTAEGEWFTSRAEGKNREDPLFDGSADGLFVIQLMTALAARKLADYRTAVRRRVDAFMKRGGIYGSINHDVYDANENVAYAVAFRTLRSVAELLSDPDVGRFAFEKALAGLEQFKMAEDRNGVATRGLLYMAKSWDTAYMWENAEAALAWLEAYADTGREAYLQDALAVLRAAAAHHHGKYGFLTEGVDWNNHVGAKHHFDGAQYGDIQYTEPFLNNQHIAEPTLYYFEELRKI